MKRKLFLLTLTCVFLSLQTTLWGQCTNPPVVICNNMMQINLSPTTGEATVFAEDFDAGSYPVNCGDNLEFRINLAGQSTSPPDDISITFNTPGNYSIVLWVIDDGGNFNACFTDATVHTSTDECDPDITAPLAVCFDQIDVTLDQSGSIEVFPSDIDAGSSDNCGEFTALIRLEGSSDPFASSITLTNIGDNIIELQLTDDAGNTSVCWGNIFVNPMDEDCEGNTVPPTAICEDELLINLLPFTNSVQIFAQDIDAGSFDDCSSIVDLRINLLGETTTPPPAPSNSIVFDVAGEFTAVLWVLDENENWNNCQTLVIVEDACENDVYSPISVCKSNLVISLGDDQSVTLFPSDIDEGSYDLCSDVTLTMDIFGDMPVFPSSDQITFNNIGSHFVAIGVEDESGNQSQCISEVTLVQEECPYLTVDMTAPFLRRCFSNFYVVNYCNYGTELAEDAYIEVSLDPFLEYLGSTIPFTSENNNVYRFDLGDIAGGDCGSFKVYFEVSCDAELGQTHCSDAIIHPNDLCGDNYTGPVIAVQGSCDLDNDQVIFTITNEGQEAMPSPLNYLVVEDVIMYVEEEPFQLGIAESIDITLPANGSTYRLEAEQPENYPWFNKVADAVEGCVNGDEFSMGMITQFSPFEAGDFISIDCQENIGSYDPNDKQANPKGVGEDNLLPKNTPIDYKIRFQNTGTDTAFQVVVVDTLSDQLDAQSILPGASSHPYTFEIRENILAFTFEDILLPDSTSNEEASNGFVQFSIKQKEDLPDGTLITNTAAIYFDFNEPIFTNEVFHIIGQPVIVSLKEIPSQEMIEVSAFPNPFQESTSILLPDTQGGIFEIFNTQGQQIAEKRFQGNLIEIQGEAFHESGLYFIRIQTNRGKILQGKLVIE